MAKKKSNSKAQDAENVVSSDDTTIKNDDAGICVINDGNFYGMVYNVGKSLTINGGYFYTNDGYEIITLDEGEDEF